MIILTGATGGLGQGVTSHLLKQGYQIHAVLRSEEAIERFRHQHQAYAAQLSWLKADLADEMALQPLQEVATQAKGLVHLAGGFEAAATIQEATSASFQQLFQTNALSAFHLLKWVLPEFRKKNQGSVVAIGSKNAVKPDGLHAAYGASKAALVHLILTAAEESRKEGVRCNVIVPGVINTKANQAWGTEHQQKQWTGINSIADAVAFLMSDQSAQITGTCLNMFGGL